MRQTIDHPQAQRDDYIASQIARHDHELEAMRQVLRAQVAEAVASGIRGALLVAAELLARRARS